MSINYVIWINYLLFIKTILNQEYSLENITKILTRANRKEFIGHWESNNENYNKKNKFLKTFSKTYGEFLCETAFLRHGFNNYYFRLTFSFLEGNLKENWLKMTIFYSFREQYNISHFDLDIQSKETNDSSTLYIKNYYVNHTHIKLYHIFQVDNILHSDIDLIELELTNSNPFNIYNYTLIKGRIVTNNTYLDISFESSLKGDHNFKTANEKRYFLIAVSVIGLINLLVFYLMIHTQYKRRGSFSFKNFAPDLIANDMCWNALICLSSVSISLNSTENSQGYAAVAFIYFFIFGFFEGLIFYFTYNFENNKEMRMLVLNCVIHIILFILTLTYLFKYTIFIIILVSTTFVSQILYNIRLKDKQNSIPLKSIISLTLSRLFIPLYMKGFKNNVFMASTNYFFCFALVVSHIVQIIILSLQSKYGGDFLIPKRCQSNYYHYKTNVRSIARKHFDFYKNQCAICLCPFVDNIEVLRNSINTRNIFKLIRDRLFYKQVYIMQTPCCHFFHIECLTSWIELKKECPICRKKLPRLY